MDPITQGAFGAAFTQLVAKPDKLAKAAIIGALAGMAPDLDVLIRSSEDSLLALEYHRQFTHSLLFIPFGGLICSLVLHPLLGKRFGNSFWQTLLWCIVGVATHGLLDSCTSYGTQLFSPVSNTRIAWDIISIIDPLVTIPLLFFIILAARRRSKAVIFIGVLYLGLYFGFATFQHQRALSAGQKLALQRGLNIENLEAKPSFANLFIWKIITTTKDAFYVDAIKIGWQNNRVWEGDSIKKFSLARDLPWLANNPEKYPQQQQDIERFRWFSSGYIALDREHNNRIIDVRYSMLPHQIKPLWGIQLSPEAKSDEHVRYYNQREDSAAASKELWRMLTE